MKILQGLFGHKDDSLRQPAEMLVDAAQVIATASFIPLLDKFPILAKANIEHWDFIITIAGVFVAATRLRNMNLGAVREERLMSIVSDKLIAWSPTRGISGFEHCKSFF